MGVLGNGKCEVEASWDAAIEMPRKMEQIGIELSK